MKPPQTEMLGASLRLGLRPALRASKIVPEDFVVRRVEQLFAFTDQLEAKIKTAQARVNHLTQSILAKAFRGELVPQDPNDEPASVLLERIKAQRAAAPKASAAARHLRDPKHGFARPWARAFGPACGCPISLPAILSG